MGELCTKSKIFLQERALNLRFGMKVVEVDGLGAGKERIRGSWSERENEGGGGGIIDYGGFEEKIWSMDRLQLGRGAGEVTEDL